MRGPSDITALLDSIAAGEAGPDELFATVYEELRQIAKAHRFRWRGDETMNTTALIHEAYLKLVGKDRPGWRGRGHFFATAARAMRHVLVNYAERRRAAKRGGDAVRVPLPDELPVDEATVLELVAVDRALAALERESPRASSVFECRVFAGLSQDETAEALGVSRSTVKRDWLFATAMIRQQMSEPGRGDGPS